jgi:16S rRNA processing protein RimM
VPDEIVLAAVTGAHGVRGEVRLKLFSEGVESLALHKEVRVGGVPFVIEWVKPGSGGAIARLAGIADRGAAKGLRGKLLSVPRTALPPLGEGEYYHADLIGLPCVGPGGEPLGQVGAVENFGAGDILEIEKPDGKRAMIPFREGIADLIDGRIVADPAFLA